MKKLLSLTAVAALLSFASNAHAATYITLGPTSSDVGYSSGGVLAPNVNLASLNPSQLSLTGDALVVNPSTTVPGQYVAPNGGSVFGNNYLAVLVNPGPAGTATYNLNPGQTVFGFTWGSVDPYNTLTITATNATYTFTGTDIANHVAGPFTLDSSDQDVTFQDNSGTILSATFNTTGNSFEVADFESTVPLPAALPLFGSALFGVGALAFRRKANI